MKYSINLLWINKKIDDHSFIYPGVTQEDVRDTYLKTAFEWTKNNPDAIVNIWYDSLLYQNIERTLENTVSLISETPNIKLRDIREIDIVNCNKDIFEEKMPFYLRIDLLKIVIMHHVFVHDAIDSTIYSDLGITNLYEKDLFSVKLLETMKSIGVQTNSNGLENQFIQACNSDEIVLAFKYSINACLNRVEFMINREDANHAYIMPTIYNVAFFSTINELHKFYMGIKENNMLFNSSFSKNGCFAKNDIWAPYNPDLHGYDLLGNFQRGESFYYFDKNRKTIPTKKIVKFGYTDDFFLEGIEMIKVNIRGGNAHRDEWNPLQGKLKVKLLGIEAIVALEDEEEKEEKENEVFEHIISIEDVIDECPLVGEEASS